MPLYLCLSLTWPDAEHYKVARQNLRLLFFFNQATPIQQSKGWDSPIVQQ